jgi:hypothetical protein
MSEVTLLTYGGLDELGEFFVFYQDGRRHQEYVFESNRISIVIVITSSR